MGIAAKRLILYIIACMVVFPTLFLFSFYYMTVPCHELTHWIVDDNTEGVTPLYIHLFNSSDMKEGVNGHCTCLINRSIFNDTEIQEFLYYNEIIAYSVSTIMSSIFSLGLLYLMIKYIDRVTKWHNTGKVI